MFGLTRSLIPEEDREYALKRRFTIRRNNASPYSVNPFLGNPHKFLERLLVSEKKFLTISFDSLESKRGFLES